MPLLMASLTYIQLVRSNRSFRRLLVGQVISELGNWFNFIAALGLVRLVSHGAAEVTTIMLVARLLPFTIFAPLAGAFVDRWSRRTVMIVSDIARILVALSMLLVRRPEDLWIAYVSTVVLSFFGAFFEAAKNAAVPNIAGERDLSGRKCVDVFVAVLADGFWRCARWLDCGDRWLPGSLCRQRYILCRFGLLNLVDS